MKIYAIRHGETDVNASGLIQGRKTNASLNEKGRGQAGQTTEKLADDMDIKITLNEFLHRIMKNFDKICYQDKEKGLYDDKGVEELYGVTKEELKMIFGIFPREQGERKAEANEEGTINFISDGGFNYSFYTRLWQYEKTSQIIKQLWITRNVIIDESDDTQYSTIQDWQEWPPNYDEATNTKFGVMFEYYVKHDDIKIAKTNKLIPQIMNNSKEAKRVGCMTNFQFFRDKHYEEMKDFRLLSLGLFRLMEQDKKRNEITAIYPESTNDENKYVEKWSVEFNITRNSTKWFFIAVHEIDGDPYFNDYVEHLKVKCPERKINMLLYYDVHIGN